MKKYTVKKVSVAENILFLLTT